ncbi:hypothetical protein LLB_3427 [Legionella longbeachae D-4968]|nr:hypothetical protein LLB_3427 [Legionella longbeachae D-4968]
MEILSRLFEPVYGNHVMDFICLYESNDDPRLRFSHIFHLTT